MISVLWKRIASGETGGVVTVVGRTEEEAGDGKGEKTRAVKAEGIKAREILREMRIVLGRVEHFD